MAKQKAATTDNKEILESGSQVLNVVMQGAQKVKHYALKLLPRPMIKNTSFKKYSPILEKFEHTHVFHNVDSQGRNQLKCAPVGGHFHYVEFAEMPDGKVSVKCGPARQIVEQKMRSGGFRKKESTIEFYDEQKDKTTHDDHTHDFELIYCKELQIDHTRATGIAATVQMLEPPKNADIKDMDA